MDKNSRETLSYYYLLLKVLDCKRKDIPIEISKLYSLPKYTKFEINKRDGRTRIIEQPYPWLKEKQKLILKQYLRRTKVSDSAVAYIKHKSIADGARAHAGQKMILKFDIINFFGSIKFQTVLEKVFLKKYNNISAAMLLTHLCTCDNHLPQGALTSPCISNIIMYEFDETVADYCEKRNINYTRYCDDMTFSGDFNPDEIIDFVQTELKKQKLYLNKKKTKCIKQGQQMTVTGIVVNEKVQLPKSYRKKIRQEVYYCKRFGAKSHILKSKQKNLLIKTAPRKLKHTLSI